MTPRDAHVEAIVELVVELDAARLRRAVRMLESHELLRLRLVLEAAADARND